MTIEYVLLLIAVFGLTLKFFISAPQDAFRTGGPRLAAKVERQLATGDGFRFKGERLAWEKDY